MIIISEDISQYQLTEMLQKAGNPHLQTLKKQMNQNSELEYTLSTPIKNLPKHQYLADPGSWLQNVPLFDMIEYTVKRSDFESYLIKNSRGNFVGFIALFIDSEKGKKIISNIKVFSFGLSPQEDENMILKDVPKLLDDCLKKYLKVTWTALKGNKTNRAYEIYCKRKKGTKEDLGNSWRYTCYGK